MPQPPVAWSDSLHQSFRLLDTPTPALPAFLQADGRSVVEVQQSLPYQPNRSSGTAVKPDPKRYRDSRLVFAIVGLVHDDRHVLTVTELGHAVRRWLPYLSRSNAPILGRHAAYALSACQLRNPLSNSGRGYPPHVEVFPFRFIWEAMLALDDRISSDELNRVLFWTNSADELPGVIEAIRDHRWSGSQDPDDLGAPAITGRAVNDRIIPWMSLASFGWVLIADKRESGDGFYHVRPQLARLLREAAQIRRPHAEFDDQVTYVQHVSNQACLPKDLR